MHHHRPGFVADRHHDALIELRCPRRTCRAVYLVPYDDLVAYQREGRLSGTDFYAERVPRPEGRPPRSEGAAGLSGGCTGHHARRVVEQGYSPAASTERAAAIAWSRPCAVCW